MIKKLEEFRRINNELDTKISKENQPLFTDMICYIRSANISELSQEMVRRDLSEIVLSAQSRGEKITDVISGDLKEFCDEVIANLPSRTLKEKLIDRLDVFCSCISILGTISIVSSSNFRNLIKNMISNQPVNYNMDVSVGIVISIFFIMITAIFIVDRITKTSLNEEKKLSKPKRLVFTGVLSVMLMALFIATWKLGTKILFSINIFLAITLLISFFIAHKILGRM